jgi:hypothetical protein
LLKFCQERIISKLPLSLRNIIKDTVVDIQPIGKTEEKKEKTNDENEDEEDGTADTEIVGLEDVEDDSPQPSCIVHFASGRSLPARAVIVASSGCTPVVPTWARAENTIEPKDEEENKQKFETIQDEETKKEIKSKFIKTWDQIDFSDSNFKQQSIKNKRIVVVGGGMTAALLALGASTHGATTVTLMARRPLLQQPFNCDIGWWGNKYLNSFWQETNPENRMKMCRQGRHQASITPQVRMALEEAVELKKVKVIQGYQVETATEMAELGAIKLEVRPTPNIDSFKLALGSTNSSSSANCASTSSSSLPLSLIEADCVWLACGSAYNVSRNTLLSTLQKKFPTRLVAGYPVLDPTTCVWPGAPVYVVGRGALLAVGPCAGELVGMRLASDRIVKSLKKMDYSGKTEWQTAAEVLAPQLTIGSASPVGAIGQNTQVSTLQPKSVLENYLELEEDGIMCYVRHIKPSVAHPPHLIDISDLPPASELPRHEIQKFSFSEDDFEISVIIQLPESVPLPSVRSLITERSLEVWAVGTEGMYRLHVPRLYGKVLPNRCKIKVNESKKKVYVVLHKEKDAEWRFLKGI